MIESQKEEARKIVEDRVGTFVQNGRYDSNTFPMGTDRDQLIDALFAEIIDIRERLVDLESEDEG